ncbi:MAG: tetratricopeptide repeat protein [Nannocystales bacterium]
MTTESSRLAALMAEQAEAPRDIEARELLAAVRRNMFAREADSLRLGRYQNLTRLGAGGMGIVYRALDPKLDRSVAIKVLHATSAASHADVLREARLLAQAPHLNIVTVLDVGVEGTESFIALELVEGPTLQAWLTERRRPWTAVVDVLIDAGRGLAAAHARGVVHRDFKPANVLIGSDGRARVSDFGLAVQVTSPATAPNGEPGHGPGPTSRHGGTLGYAAPEQLHGAPHGPVDTRADQFAFGVCLFEALAGERPFASTSVASYEAAVAEASPAIAQVRAPRAVRNVIVRALACRPERRFADMDALVNALVKARRSHRLGRQLTAWVGGMSIVGATGVFATQTDVRCPAGREVPELWDSAARTRTRARFDATSLPYAAASFDAADGHLRSAVLAWTAEYQEVCDAGSATLSEAHFDARLACLQTRRAGLVALTTLLQRADASIVEHAVQSAASLATVTACDEAEPVPTTGTQRQTRAELARQVAAARVLITAGAYDDADQALGVVPSDADETVHGRVLAEHAAARGQLEKMRGAYPEAAGHLARAYHLATAVAYDRCAALAAAELAMVIGAEQGQLEEADRWRRHAEAALERWGGTGVDSAAVHTSLAALARARSDLDGAEGSLRHAAALLVSAHRAEGNRMANVLTTLGAVLHDAGRYDEALASLRRALMLLEQTFGSEHPGLLGTLQDLGASLHARGDFAESVAVNERALRLAQETLGPDHVRVGGFENTLGNVAMAQHDDATARPHYERALEIFRAELGPDNPRTMTPLVNLGSIHARTGRYDLEQEYVTRALEVVRTSKGADAPAVGQLLVNLGRSHQQQGDGIGAREHYEEALLIFERRLGANHPYVAVVLVNLATLAIDAGDAQTAWPKLARALQIRETALGVEHPAVASTLLTYGVALTHVGRFEEADAHLRRALRMHHRLGHPPSRVAKVELALADVQWEGGDRVLARTTAKTARLRCVGTDSVTLAVHAEIVAWTQTHPASRP